MSRFARHRWELTAFNFSAQKLTIWGACLFCVRMAMGMPRAALLLRWTFAGLSIVLFGEVPSFATDLDEFAAANLLFGAAVLQTGNGAVLVRTNLSWSAPTNLTHP